MSIPETLSLIRGKLKLTRAEMAEKLGIPVSTYNNMEAITNKNFPTGAVLYQYLLQFGVNINFLLTGKGDMFLNSRTFRKDGVTFTKGDYVKLKTGSPTMTVMDFRSGEVSCCWYDQFDEFNTKSFPAGALKKIPFNK